MNNKRPCPECNNWLDITDPHCKCGWKGPKEDHAAKPIIVDHRCIYQHNGRRCPYPGDMSPSTHAATVWYCAEHYHHRGDQERSVEIVMDAERDYIAVMEGRIDWKIKLFAEDHEKAKKTIREDYFRLFKK